MREVRWKLLTTVPLEFQEEAWAIRQLARMHDPGTVSPGDGNRAALLACIDLDYVRPPYSFVFPYPKCLLQAIRIDEDGSRIRGEKPDTCKRKGYGGQNGE